MFPAVLPPAAPSRRRGRVAALLLALLLSAAVQADADPYATQRASFEKVLKAQSAGRHDLARQLVVGLEDYPLYPYYLFEDLRRRLHHYPTDEVARFLVAYDGSYLAARLRRDWLKQLARAPRWQAFLEFYRPQSDLTLRCHQIEARIRGGLLEGVLEDTRAIWLSGESLPDACDPAFDRLYASDLMGDALLWQRIALAMAAGNRGLARYLARRLDGARYRALHALWDTAHVAPASALARRDLADDADTRTIMIHALRRLLRNGIEGAEQAWQQVAPRFTFSDGERGAVAAAIAVAAAGSDHPRRIALLDQVPAAGIDGAVERYRLREGVAARAWAELARWTAHPPTSDVNPLRWRYWRARALERLGQTTEAHALYEQLASERDYYGFVAADALDRDYAFNFVPVAPTAEENVTVMALPGIARTHELYRLDRRFQARRELYHELDRLDVRQREVVASLAAAWGWHESAIAALGHARSWNDLELRFPLLHQELAIEYGQRRKLSPAQILAITRSESAFVVDARSPAGALGLMQLMPATARETARSIGLKLGNMRQLHDPRTNVALGSAYLARLLGRYGGSFVMAAAAYNAGPHRVRQWQNAACTPADVWIDTIPFTETRRYVRRALFYTAVYEWRLQREVTRLRSVMPPVPAAGSNQTADCTS